MAQGAPRDRVREYVSAYRGRVSACATYAIGGAQAHVNAPIECCKVAGGDGAGGRPGLIRVARGGGDLSVCPTVQGSTCACPRLACVWSRSRTHTNTHGDVVTLAEERAGEEDASACMLGCGELFGCDEPSTSRLRTDAAGACMSELRRSQVSAG
jgi:hypothetical protein